MKKITLNKEEYVSKKDYETLAKKKAGKTIVGENEIPFVIGGKYFIRTVTYFATGEVESIKGNFLVLKDASWIADTGRFRDAIMSGVLNEVEPVEVPMYLNINTITDAFDWQHELPREQK
jgi:hypothetical protein